MCLDEQILNTYIDGELTEPWKSQVGEHLSFCDACKSRMAGIQATRDSIRAAVLPDEEIEFRKKRVLLNIEKNHLGKRRGIRRFLHKTFTLSARGLVGMAAAFVVVFIGSWTILGGSKDESRPLVADIPSPVALSNITPVRASDNAATSKTLEDYSLDDILRSLDARGYDVDIRIKSISPIFLGDGSGEESKPVLLIPSMNYVVMSDGNILDSEGHVVMTGTVIKDDTVLSTDGQILFDSDFLVPLGTD